MTNIASEDFARIEALFTETADLSPDERSRRLTAELRDRPDLLEAVGALLSAHDRLAAADVTAAARVLPGARLGPYVLGDKIGEGGMGEVFRAERVDGAFTQTVAVKVTRAVGYRDETLRRFRNERQILASLQHPNIVTLLDGGATSEGQMYFVMEYIEGIPISHYCRDHALGFDERLTLFQAVCTAVQYAHQHGVVHRDLKPANILVQANGIPKVLDFGLAKLLNTPSIDATTTIGAMPAPLTPNYASPEQLRGVAVTTASDVYGLGVMLYELLTGTRPYDTHGQPLDKVVELVIHRDPPRPSVATPAVAVPYPSRRLRGDIEAVILKAMSKEPGARYDSAGELASDLSRVLDGAPVLARPLTTGYMLRRLAARHKTIVTVAALALAAVLVASGVALWQREVARREQARAEALFKDVRQLANSLIFKVHDAVMPLSGSTEVRRTIVNDAIAYLERLEAQSTGDRALRLELAAAYRQIAGILGDPQKPNLGDRDGALKQFERSRAIAASLLTPDAEFEVIESLVLANHQLSTLYSQKSEPARAISVAREAVESVTRFTQRHADDQRGLKLLGLSNFRLAWVLPPPEAVPVWERTLAYYDGQLRARPDSAEAQRNVALMCKYYAGALDATGRRDDAVAQWRRAAELDEKRFQATPNHRQTQLDAAISYGLVATALERKGDLEGANSLYQRSVELRRLVVDSDPKDVLARERLAFGLASLARLEGLLGHYDRARSYGRSAISTQEAVLRTTSDRTSRYTLGYAWYETARIELAAGNARAACVAFREAYASYAAIKDTLTPDALDVLAHAARESASCRSTP